MATYVTLDLVEKIKARVKEGNFIGYSDYLRYLIRQDLEREVEKQ